MGEYRHEHRRSPLCEGQSGATAIEYALIAAIVAVGIIVGFTNLRDGLNTLFNNVKTSLTSAS